jgi:hypothetical protein
VALLDERHLGPARGERVGAGEADDATTDDTDVHGGWMRSDVMRFGAGSFDVKRGPG